MTALTPEFTLVVPRTRASLPDPSGIGFFVMVPAVCVLVALNSVLTTALYQALDQTEIGWLSHPRIGQPVLFLMPLLLVMIELWAGSTLWRYFARTRKVGNS